MTEVAGDALDRQVRVAAFEFLAQQTRLHGETVSWARLLQGFDFQGRRVPLVSQPGIFKPAILPEVPLTIRTAPEEEGRARPYADEMDAEGRLRYRYRGTDPHHPDNVGLRRAMQRRLPLIYLFGVVPGQYMPVWPVYVVGDELATLSFLVSVDDQKHALPVARDDDRVVEARRAYVTVVTQRRLHQQTFRQRVLCARIRSDARSASFGIWSCSRPPTSCRTATREASPSSPMAWRSARCIMRPSIGTCSGSARISSWTFGWMCCVRRTGRCSSTGFGGSKV